MTKYRVDCRVDGGDWHPVDTFFDHATAEEYVGAVMNALCSAGTPPVSVEYRIVAEPDVRWSVARGTSR